jgi:hypothetical protein
VNPTFSREWLFGDAIVRVSGAGERIGSTGDLSNITSWQRRVSDRGYSRLVSADPAPSTELVRNAEFVRGLGDSGYLAKVADLHSMSTLTSDEAFVAAIGGSAQRYYVFFPGSAWSGKRWPLASFAQLADQVCRQTGWRGVVCGGAEDIELAKNLCSQSTAPLLNWAGRTSLGQLAAILSGSELLVANDTSATHIAAACGVPSVCILGGGHYGRFLPYQVELMDERPLPRVVSHQMPCFGCGWQCIYETPDGHPHPCIDHVTVAAVWSEVGRILEPILSRGRSEPNAHSMQCNW